MLREVTLLTGATGFIGSHLARKLVARGEQVHAIVRPGTALSKIADIADRIVVHRADLADRDAVRAIVEGVAPERVFHLAADTGMASQRGMDAVRACPRAYLEPAINLIEALAALPAAPSVFVRTGTIGEYGRAQLPFREDRRARPTTPYGVGMLGVTDCLEMLAPSLSFPIVTARLALTYGPGQSTGFLVPGFIDAGLSRRPITLMRPHDRRDLIHVDDAVDALLRIAERAGPDCTIVNVSSGLSVAVEEVAAMIVRLTGCDPGLVTARQPLPGEAPEELCCCPEQARLRFGWTASIPLEDGLIRTIEAERHASQTVR